jgi:hypothetical protein
MGYAQSDTLVTVLPLSLGNQWTYRYYTWVWGMDDVIVSDSGLAVYTVIAVIPSPDSFRWIFQERRNIQHRIDHIFPNMTPDTSWPVVDSSTFEVIELQTDRHRLFRDQPDDSVWQSAFPWSIELTDTVSIYRYSFVDSTGIMSFHCHPGPPTPYYSRVYDFSFQRGIGQTRVRAETSPYITGIGFHSDHLLLSSIISAVPDEHELQFPRTFALGQNYPNPFNPITTIPFQLRTSAWVRLHVYNDLGELVAVLLDEQKSPGEYEVTWSPLSASGVYYYQLVVGLDSQVKKALFLK